MRFFAIFLLLAAVIVAVHAAPRNVPQWTKETVDAFNAEAAFGRTTQQESALEGALGPILKVYFPATPTVGGGVEMG